MAISEEKFPWESYTEMVAFVGLLIGLATSFNLLPVVITPEQIAGIASILFLIVMIVRKYSSGGKIVLTKTNTK